MVTQHRREYSKKWREQNPDYQKQWCKDNPDYHKQWMREYRRKKKELEGEEG